MVWDSLRNTVITGNTTQVQVSAQPLTVWPQASFYNCVTSNRVFFKQNDNLIKLLWKQTEYHRNIKFLYQSRHGSSCPVKQTWIHLVPMTSLGGGSLIFFIVQRGDWGPERFCDLPASPSLTPRSRAPPQAAWLENPCPQSPQCTVLCCGWQTFLLALRLRMSPPKGQRGWFSSL